MWSRWRCKGNIHSRGYRLLLRPAKWSPVEPTVMGQRATHKPVTPETMLKRSSTSNGYRNHVHKHSGDIVTLKMKEIAAGVQAGERSRLAEAITLGGYSVRCMMSSYITDQSLCVIVHHQPVALHHLTSLTSRTASSDITDQSLHHRTSLTSHTVSSYITD